MKERVQLVF